MRATCELASEPSGSIAAGVAFVADRVTDRRGLCVEGTGAHLRRFRQEGRQFARAQPIPPFRAFAEQFNPASVESAGEFDKERNSLGR